ncbi:MAG: hypothetical protein JST00_08905 [Deltaproteobacteria bacterium]|nr:hypothetical protein [Deltaproteobacteria bacterium]
MLRTTGLFGCAFVLGITIVGIACGGSASDSEFGSSGSSGASSGASGGTSGGSSSFGGTSGTSGTPEPPKQDECRKMDILFVVDNSGSMEQEQKNLATNFPNFIKVIGDYKTKGGESLDYRVAVTTSDDEKDKGKFIVGKGASAPSSCMPGPSRPWLERADGDVSSFFSCRAQVGTDGSGTERPLESALLGVTARITDKTNTSGTGSFVRDDALLALVVISDEDEGSAGGAGSLKRPMNEYPTAFDKVKGGERGKWATAVIAGPGPGTCRSDGLGNAAEATRLKSFVATVGKNGIFASICEGDLTKGLTAALNTFTQACKDFPAGPVK